MPVMKSRPSNNSEAESVGSLITEAKVDYGQTAYNKYPAIEVAPSSTFLLLYQTTCKVRRLFQIFLDPPILEVRVVWVAVLDLENHVSGRYEAYHEQGSYVKLLIAEVYGIMEQITSHPMIINGSLKPEWDRMVRGCPMYLIS